MTPAARIEAAIEVLADILARRRPAPDALKDWGLSHRFAGSKDRSAIASLVYDALRRRASSAWLMGEESARAVMLGALRIQLALSVDEIAALASGDRHGPAALTDDERARLQGSLADAPEHVRADAPEWVWPMLQAAFGDAAVDELVALAARAPVDIRVNDLKTSRNRLLPKLEHLSPALTPYSPDGLRFSAGVGGRTPSLQTEKEFLDGLFEIQDEGSQLAARLSGAQPGETVVDLCAGAGGKALSLAALMQNRGQLFATDIDSRRLTPIYVRLKRAGVRNVQVRSPRLRGDDSVADLAGKADLVLVDAPCTGSGTWRRNPDAKWRLRPGALEERRKEQAAVLDAAAALIRPGGRIAYITCSILPEENDGTIDAFLGRRPGHEALPPQTVCEAAGLPALAHLASPRGFGVQMTPLRCGTDGFYVCVLRREA